MKRNLFIIAIAIMLAPLFAWGQEIEEPQLLFSVEDKTVDKTKFYFSTNSDTLYLISRTSNSDKNLCIRKYNATNGEIIVEKIYKDIIASSSLQNFMDDSCKYLYLSQYMALGNINIVFKFNMHTLEYDTLFKKENGSNGGFQIALARPGNNLFLKYSTFRPDDYSSMLYNIDTRTKRIEDSIYKWDENNIWFGNQKNGEIASRNTKTGKITFYDINGFIEKETIDLKTSGRDEIAYNSDSSLIATRDSNDAVLIYNLINKQRVKTTKDIYSIGWNPNIAFLGNDDYLITNFAIPDNYPVIFNWKTDNIVYNFNFYATNFLVSKNKDKLLLTDRGIRNKVYNIKNLKLSVEETKNNDLTLKAESKNNALKISANSISHLKGLYTISDINGLELKKGEIDLQEGDNIQEYNIDNLSRGAYFFTIKYSNKALTAKFINE